MFYARGVYFALCGGACVILERERERERAVLVGFTPFEQAKRDN